MADLTERIKTYAGNAFSKAADFVERHAYEAKLSLVLFSFAALGYSCGSTKGVTDEGYDGEYVCPLGVVLSSGKTDTVQGTAKFWQEGENKEINKMKFSVDSVVVDGETVSGSITYTDIKGSDMIFRTYVEENGRKVWKKYIIDADSVTFTGIYANDYTDTLTISPRYFSNMIDVLNETAKERVKAGFEYNDTVITQQIQLCRESILGIQRRFYDGEDFRLSKKLKYITTHAKQGKETIVTPVDKATLNLFFDK